MKPTFITWPVADDVSFRQKYFEKTGEEIQENPPLTADGLSYVVGSWRVTSAQISQISKDNPSAVFGDKPSALKIIGDIT